MLLAVDQLYYQQVVDIIMLLAVDHCYITDKLGI